MHARIVAGRSRASQAERFPRVVDTGIRSAMRNGSSLRPSRASHHFLLIMWNGRNTSPNPYQYAPKLRKTVTS
ncbi:MAG: hypothetical protein RLZZ562_1683 [Planctomycetota bacterium]